MIKLSTRLIPMFCLLAAGTQVQAQDKDPLYDFITGISQKEAVETVLYGDIDQDGANEAVMVLAAKDGEKFHEWRYVDMLDGKPAVTFAWSAEEVRIDETEDEGRIIWSDGVTFAAGKAGLYPYDDLVRQNIAFLREATEGEVKVFTDLGLKGVLPNSAQAVRVDFLKTPGSEVVISLSDEFHADDFYVSPYVILDAKGKLLHAGVSQFHPAIYPDPKGGANIVERTRDGYGLLHIDDDEGEGKDE